MLTEKRKADREKLARLCEDVAAQHGWKSERCEFNTTLRTRVNMTGPRGLSVSVEFESDSCQPDNYCLPWHFASKYAGGDETAELTDCFGWMQASSVNTCHRRKCTAFAAGADALKRKLETAMMLANGTDTNGNTAFMPPAAFIMKNHAAYHPPGANHYERYSSDWQRLSGAVMLPDEAKACGLVSVSPMQVHSHTAGRM